MNRRIQSGERTWTRRALMSLALLILVSNPVGSVQSATPTARAPGQAGIWSELPREAVLELPPLDGGLLRQEDARTSGPGTPLRIGVGRELPEITLEDGRLDYDPELGWLWRLRIVSPGAYRIRLHLQDMDLGTRGELFVHADGADAFVFTRRGPRESGQVWTWATPGESVDVEWSLPPESAPPEALPFHLTELTHVYRDYLAEQDPWTEEGACHNDVTCYVGWADQRAATAYIEYVDGGSGYLCSGTMLNNTSEDCTPYFMTAHHCIDSDIVAATVQVFFYYHTSICDSGAASYGPSKDGAVVRSTHSSSDYSLLELDPNTFTNVYFAGWSRYTPGNGEALTAVHHPEGAYKRISFADRDNIYTNTIEVEFNSGSVEQGSSGSGLFRDSSGLFLGQLWGLVSGTGGCGDLSSIYTYGRFRESYDLGAGTWLGAGTTLTGKYYATPLPTATPTITPTSPPTATPTPAVPATTGGGLVILVTGLGALLLSRRSRRGA